MTSRVIGLGLTVAVAAAPMAALAQQTPEAIPTQAGAPWGGAAPLAPQADTLRLSDHFDSGPDFLRPSGPCGGPAKSEDGKTDKSPHGAVWAGVGTRGYREIGGAVCLPLGDNGAVSIAVDAGQINGWGRRR
jgi:hypothetical protein